MKRQSPMINLKDKLPKTDPEETFYVCRISVEHDKFGTKQREVDFMISENNIKKIIAKGNLKKDGDKLMINRNMIPNVFVHIKTDDEWFPMTFVQVEVEDEDPINMEHYSPLAIFALLS